MKSSDQCVIGLGANLPTHGRSPRQTLEAALAALDAAGGVAVRAVARWRASPAYPAGSGPDFVNGAALLETDLEPAALLALMHAVEAELGRERRRRYGPRGVDLDLLCWGDRITPDRDTVRAWIALPKAAWTETEPDALLLPHPRLQDRAFALAPLLDVAPDWTHPVLGRSGAALLAALPEADRAALRFTSAA